MEIYELISKFETGDTPTGKDFEDLIRLCFNDNEKIQSLGFLGDEDLISSINNTPNGSTLILKNKEKYILNSDININKDIKINLNGSTIEGNYKILITDNFEVYNGNTKGVSFKVNSVDKNIVIRDLNTTDSYDNFIDCWTNLNYLEVKNINCYGTVVSTSNGKNINNSGSLVYLNGSNGGKINTLKISNLRAYNVLGGTVLFLGGEYPNLILEDIYLDSMCQRGIGFWNTKDTSRGYVRRCIIKKCGVLKEPGLGPGNEGAGVGCNAIYTNTSVYGITVEDCEIDYVYENGIEGRFGLIRRNIIKNTGMDLINYPTPSYEAIYCANNTIVEDNVIINPKGNGIYTFYTTDNHHDITIKGNRIISEQQNSNVGICLRSPSSTNISNITIEDNYIKGFDTVIEIPNNKTYSNVKIGKNEAYNYSVFYKYAVGQNIDMFDLAKPVNLVKDGIFNEWSSDVALSNWTHSNASVSKSVNDNKYNAVVTATDNFKGRLVQKVQTLPGSDNRKIAIKIRAKGNNDILIRMYKLNIDGSVNSSVVQSRVLSGVNNEMKNFYLLLNSVGSFQLEICNNGVSGSYYEISEVEVYMIDKSF